MDVPEASPRFRSRAARWGAPAMSAPEYLGKRWRVKTENHRNDPESLAEFEKDGFVGFPKFLPSAMLVTEEDDSFLLPPPMSPGFCDVLGHLCDLHNASLEAPRS